MERTTATPADLDEARTLRRYLQLRRLSEMVSDAERRADAQRRLEYALRIATL